MNGSITICRFIVGASPCGRPMLTITHRPLEQSEEGGYTVYVPELPGCIREGATEEEALENIKEAIELYLEPLEDEWL